MEGDACTYFFYFKKIKRGVDIEPFYLNLKQFLDNNIENNLQSLKSTVKDYSFLIEKREENQKILLDYLDHKQTELFVYFYEDIAEIRSIELSYFYLQGIKDCLRLTKILESETAENKEFIKIFL